MEVEPTTREPEVKVPDAIEADTAAAEVEDSKKKKKKGAKEETKDKGKGFF